MSRSGWGSVISGLRNTEINEMKNKAKTHNAVRLSRTDGCNDAHKTMRFARSLHELDLRSFCCTGWTRAGGVE